MTLLERLGLRRSHGVGQAGWGWSLLAAIVSVIYFFPVLWIILTAFKTLTFPEPDGGKVTVVYPIVFSPGD